MPASVRIQSVLDRSVPLFEFDYDDLSIAPFLALSNTVSLKYQNNKYFFTSISAMQKVSAVCLNWMPHCFKILIPLQWLLFFSLFSSSFLYNCRLQKKSITETLNDVSLLWFLIPLLKIILVLYCNPYKSQISVSGKIKKTQHRHTRTHHVFIYLPRFICLFLYISFVVDRSHLLWKNHILVRSS